MARNILLTVFVLIIFPVMAASGKQAISISPPPPPPPIPDFISATPPPDAIVEKIEKEIIITGDIKQRVASVSVNPDEIDTVQQLQDYALKIISENPDLRLIKLTPAGIEGEYRYLAGRLLGIIPVKVYAKFIIKNDGGTDFKLPWYHRFMSDKDERFQGSKIRQHMYEKNKSGNLNDINRRAQALNELASALRRKPV